MSKAAYTMLTVASCAPEFLKDALDHTAKVAEELRADAGAVGTRVGVMATGSDAGSLFLLQTYNDLGGIDAALSVYEKSKDYKALIGSGKISITLRNILKLEDVGLTQNSDEVPAFGVATRMGTQGPMVEEARALVPNFENNGAMFLRYGTLITGSAAGRRVLLVAYPSMDAIEKSYDALRADPKYAAFIAKAEIDFRNIIRITA